MSHKLSIIMPAFGLAKHKVLFSNAIKGIIDQTYNNWELIIVCDGNNDNTKTIIASELGKYDDPRIKPFVYLQGEAGPGVIRNYGFARAKGKYITFHDSDDFSEPTRFEKLIQVLNSGKDIVASNVLINFVDEPNQNRIKQYSGENFNIFVEQRKVKPPMHMSSAIMTYELFQKMGGFESYKFSSDSIFVIKLGLFRGIKGTEPIPMIKEPLFVWNRQPHSITTLQSNSYILKKCISAQRKPLKREVRDRIISKQIHSGLPDKELRAQLIIVNNLTDIKNKLVEIHSNKARKCMLPKVVKSLKDKKSIKG